MGGLIGPLAYWGYLGGRRDKTRRAYQEALARVATIVRDVIGRGGSLKEAIAAVAKRGPVVTQVDFEGANTALASGQSLEKGLEPLGERRRDPIAGLLVEILLVHVKHGGRVKTVLDRLAAAARRPASPTTTSAGGRKWRGRRLVSWRTCVVIPATGHFSVFA